MNATIAQQLENASDDAALVAALLGVAELGQLDDAEAREQAEEAMGKIIESPVLTSRALLVWLSDPPQSRAAKNLLHQLSVSHLQDEGPSGIELPSNADSVAASRVVRRINSLYVCVPYALGWATAVLRRWGDSSTDPWQATRQALVYLREEFPEALLPLLQKADLSEMAPDALELLNSLTQDLVEEDSVLRGYPRLAEFAMSREELEYVRVVKMTTEKDIFSIAKGKSVFWSIFQTHKFKYSTSVVLGTGAASVPVQMKAHSVETHLPISEIVDPIGGMHKRDALWKGERK